MKVIKIMADYQCFPLWLTGEGQYENISGDQLPITKQLKKRLSEWQALYDKTLNQADPKESGFLTAEEADEFDKEGFLIWHEIKRQLIGLFEVTYFSNKTRIIYPENGSDVN